MVVVDTGSRDGIPQAVAAPDVAVSDDDSRWEPGALRRAADVMGAEPGVALVAARVLVGPEGRRCRGSSPAAPWCAARTSRRSAASTTGSAWGREGLLAVDLVQAGRLLVDVPEVVARHQLAAVRDSERRRRVQARSALRCACLRRPVRGRCGRWRGPPP